MNRLQRTLAKLDGLPAPLRSAARNFALRRAVPLTGTAGLDFVALTPERSEIRIANKKAVHVACPGQSTLKFRDSAAGDTGVLRDWWTKEDAEAFKARSLKLVGQFNGYFALPDMAINGQLTLGDGLDCCIWHRARVVWGSVLKGGPRSGRPCRRP